MVVAVGGPALAVDMSEMDLSVLLDGTYTKKTATAIDVDEGYGFVAHFSGFGFTFGASGDPTGGTITGISEDHLGQLTFSLTGMNLSAATFYSWVVNEDDVTSTLVTFAGDDSVTGTVFDDVLGGFAGNDYLAGGSGNDILSGAGGNDHLYGQSANGGVDGADVIRGGDGADYLQGNAGNDTLEGGNGSDRINGGADNDKVIGEEGNDTVNGNLGNDSIDGGTGNDSLRGGQGNDSINGGGNDDILSGDKGADTLTGGSGTDYFRFNAGDAAISGTLTDVITDFQHGIDHVQINFAPAAIIYVGGAGSLAVAQTLAQASMDQHGGDHEVALAQVGSDTYLFWNGTGGGTIDSALLLQGVGPTVIAAADF